jgi:hypothetical protein
MPLTTPIFKSNIDKYLYYDLTSPSGLRWKVTKSSKVIKGSVAGTKTVKGYYRIKVDGILYQSHRLVWVIFNGDLHSELVINHIDTNVNNNNIDNLELCTHKHNSNTSKAHLGISLRTNNTSGLNGIHECNNGTGNYYAKVTWYDEGKPRCKSFSYIKLGKEEAWKQALAFKEAL